MRAWSSEGVVRVRAWSGEGVCRQDEGLPHSREAATPRCTETFPFVFL